MTLTDVPVLPLPPVSALIFVGRLGTAELAAVSISDVWMYSTAMIVWNGLSSTQASLVSQAHGAGHVAAARGWAVIGFSLNLVGAALCAVWWAATDPVLNALSLDSRLDRASVRAYSLWSILSLLPIAFNCVVSAQLVSLQARPRSGVKYPPLGATSHVAAPTHPPQYSSHLPLCSSSL